MYNQQFPVPVDRPLENQYVRGTAPSPPNTPNVGMLQPSDVYDIHNTLINDIQSAAHTRKSPVRILMFNLYSQNGYNNQPYADVFDSAIVYCAFLKAQGVFDAIQRSARETLQAEVPIVVNSFPAIQQYLSPQQISDVNQLAGMRQNIANGIMQWMGAGQGMGMGMRPAPAMGMGGMTPVNQSAFNRAALASMSPYGGQPAPTPMGGSRRPGTGAMSGNMGGFISQPASAPIVETASRRPPVGAMLDTTVGSRDRFDSFQSVAAQSVQPSSHWTDNAVMSAKPVDVKYYRYAPAVLEHQAIISRQISGHKEYAIINKDEMPMNYEDHETSKPATDLTKVVVSGPAGHVPADWRSVSGATALPSEVDGELVNKLNELPNSPIIVEDAYAALSLTHGRATVYRHLHEIGLRNLNDRVIEYYLKLFRPIVANPKEIEVVVALRETGSATALIDAFGDLKDKINLELWYIIHNRLTSLFNRRLQAGAGQSWSIESITDDYDAAMELISKDLPGAGADRFRQHLYDGAVKILGIDTFEEVKGGCSDVSEECTMYALTEMVSVTRLPWTSREIGLKLPKTYSMLSEAIGVEMFGACNDIIERTSKKSLNIGRRYMTTADDVWLALFIGDMNKDTILISQVNN